MRYFSKITSLLLAFLIILSVTTPIWGHLCTDCHNGYFKSSCCSKHKSEDSSLKKDCDCCNKSMPLLLKNAVANQEEKCQKIIILSNQVLNITPQTNISDFIPNFPERYGGSLKLAIYKLIDRFLI